MAQKELYLVLTQTGTSVSNLLRWATGYPYNHCSIAFDAGLEEMYSFARRMLYCTLVAGLVREEPEAFVYARFPNTRCQVYRIPVSPEQYWAARRALAPFVEQFERYKYDILGFPLRAAGVKWKREYHYVCSEFVGHILEQSGVARFDKDLVFLHPHDLSMLPQAQLIYEGTLGDYTQAARGARRFTEGALAVK